MFKRVLITGAAGFIGSNFYRRCLETTEFKIFAVDNMSNGHSEFLPHLISGQTAPCIVDDFASSQVLNLIHDQKIDVVVHLAAVPRVSYSVEHPLETNDVNVTRTLKLIDVCAGNVEKFIFASSSSVYGGADVEKLGPTHEDHPKNPKSPYALQKSIIEDYLKMYGELYGLNSMCMRFFNVFGMNQLGDSPYATAVSAWLSAIYKDVPMRSDGTGEQSRDMCHVDNVTGCLLKAIGSDLKVHGRQYNVACGDRVSNNEILSYLTKRYPQARVRNAPWRPGDVMHTHADITRARKELGYEPECRFWEGLEKTIEWAEKTPEFLTLNLRT